MTGVDENAQDFARDIFKYNLKASASVKTLFGEYDMEEAEAALLVAFRELREKIDDEQRLRRVVLITEQLARNVGSEALLLEVQDTIEEEDGLELAQEAMESE